MGFYVIDKYNTFKISDGYFTIYSEKFFFENMDYFDINSFNKNYEVFIFIYDYEDFHEVLKLSNIDIKFKVIVMNKFINSQLKKTKNLDYVYINEFLFKLKDYLMII
mgnify:CR=1 FL=1